MLKKTFIILTIILAILVTAYIGIKQYFKPNAETVLNFIVENPDKSAITLIRNDSQLADINSDRMMPLASTVKIIIAIEYAIQAANGKIDPNEMIDLSSLDRYAVGYDGGAHRAWLRGSTDFMEDDQIQLREVAKGMIKYSSNANTEWLSERLGLDKINSRLDSLGLKDHSEIYYLASSIFIGKEKFPDLNGEDLALAISAVPLKEYIEATQTIHAKLALPDTAYKKKVGDLNMDVQKVWSDNLPSSTTKEYVSIMKKINSREYFNPQTHEYLDEVMEYILENPANKIWLDHSGMKGGSTAFVLTKALYATDNEGNKTEMAYFFNELGLIEMRRLMRSMNEFELKVLRDDRFREKLPLPIQSNL
tara:strand:- start:1174 stop:2265 length:1092 start_codon:yes stop_codon:yes gene_type:complete